MDPLERSRATLVIGRLPTGTPMPIVADIRAGAHNFSPTGWLQCSEDHMEAGALRAPAALNRISVTAPLLRLRSDEQLVALFRAGNDVAFGVIHDRYRQRLFVYARQMLGGARQDAEDALQDVFLRAYSSLRDNDRPVSLRAWLYRVAHNRCIDHLRKPVPPAIDLFETSRRPLRDPTLEAERRDDLRRLIEDVRRLPEQQRSALLMREMDGLTYAELADALGVSLQAVKSLLVRARIGLVEAAEARDTACVEIRGDLADAFDRGVRASGRARRHMRDCSGCAEYRGQLRAVRDGLGALSPGPGLLVAALKLVGIGGAAGGGAASGGAAAGGGAVVVAGGGASAKVTAVVCCAALAAGGAAEVRHQILPSHGGGATAAGAGATKAAVNAAPGVAAAASPIHDVRTGRPAPAASTPASSSRADAAKARIGASGTGLSGALITHGTASPTRGAQDAPLATARPDAVDEVTGGVTAPDEAEGFGHGVDGLTPREELPHGPSTAPGGPPEGGGA
ncbi:MAG: sigma-70 family RNA polymerase sigma factor, partial [Solirubrobacteraceae bacterium]|nr:sigma-70 family RNA polymerase sigma factor [Solirubrobacteraceae bacterium]